MKPALKFSTYSRAAFLKTVPPSDLATAVKLCALLEAAFSVQQISIYAGFPVVVRDMEWVAGFAMRVRGPIAYCCSKEVLATMGNELAPFMCGKVCVAVKAKNGVTLDAVLAIIGRAFVVTSKHGGVICKAAVKKRDKLRALEARSGATKTKPITAKKPDRAATTKSPSTSNAARSQALAGARKKSSAKSSRARAK